MSDGISDNIGFCACGPSDSDIFPVPKELADAYIKGQIKEEVGATIGNPNCVAGVTIEDPKPTPTLHERLMDIGYSARDADLLIAHVGVVDVKRDGDTVTLSIKPKECAQMITIHSVVLNGPPKTP